MMLVTFLQQTLREGNLKRLFQGCCKSLAASAFWVKLYATDDILYCLANLQLDHKRSTSQGIPGLTVITLWANSTGDIFLIFPVNRSWHFVFGVYNFILMYVFKMHAEGVLCKFCHLHKSTLVISNYKGLSEILRDIRTSTYQICRIGEKLIRLTTFNKYMCTCILNILKILWKRGEIAP